MSAKRKRNSANSAKASGLSRPRLPERLVSGGQTGVDRAALDFAIEHGIPHGGWCPAGRRAEDGEIASAYALHETPEVRYPQRTEWNVRDSDGTVILTIACELTGGSALTRELALAHHKPCLHLAQAREGEAAVGRLAEFIERYRIRTLNVAGAATVHRARGGRVRLACARRIVAASGTCLTAACDGHT